MNIQAWWIASRPKTLIVSIAPVLLGLSLAFHNEVFSSYLVGIFTLISALMIQIGTNLINDLYDFIKGADTSNRIGPTRVVQSGMLSKRQVKFGAFVCFLMAFIIGVYLVMKGGRPILLIGSLAIISGYCYTAGPYPLGYNGFGDLFVFIFFGLIAVPGTYYLQSGGSLFNIDSILIGSSIGCIAVGILCVNNIRDINEDMQAGKKTLAVRFGSNFVSNLYKTMISLPYIFIVILFFRESFFWNLSLCLLLLSIPIAVKLIIDINKIHGSELNYLLIRTSNFMRLFFVLLFIGIML